MTSQKMLSHFLEGLKKCGNPATGCGNHLSESGTLKELTEGHHQEWSLWLNLTQHGKSHQARTLEGLTD